MNANSHSLNEPQDEFIAILEEVTLAGYELTKTTSKFSEFSSPAGQAIYVMRKTSRINNIDLYVHPGYKSEILRSIDGVFSVSDNHQFHSNMAHFPKCINKGKTETTYGWKITIDALTNLPKFLNAFNRIPSH